MSQILISSSDVILNRKPESGGRLPKLVKDQTVAAKVLRVVSERQAHLLIKGERVSIEAATVAGDIRTLLNSIVNMEAEQVITPGGVSPHVWVEGLSITGEA